MALHIKSLVKIFIRDRLPFFCTFDSSFFFSVYLFPFLLLLFVTSSNVEGFMSGSVGFRYIGLIFAWSGMRTFFCPALQTVATQVPSMCMLVDQNFFSPDVENWIHCSFILPIYLSVFFFHLHFINTRIALIHLYHKSFLFECNPIKGEAKQQVLPLNAHLFFFPCPLSKICLHIL